MKMARKKYRYTILRAIILLAAVPLITVVYASEGRCGQNVKVSVKTIYASKKDNTIDPRIKNLVRELNSVIKYTSYELLSQKNLSLEKDKKAVVQLPGGRTMSLVSKGVEGGRVTLQIEYSKKGSGVIQTNIDFRNNGDVTLAGPEYKGGVLFFHILTSF